ncbi:serine/threonine protein kinase [bacterium]|nr:serine/threonine protein kinase [bacterium]
MESGTDKPVDRAAGDEPGATRLERQSPTARSPFGPGNQPPADSDSALPQSLQGRYKLLRVLGKGGFATVYLAHDNVLDQQVAIKILKLSMTSKADQERFLREARIGARLRHHNIAQVFDIILAPDGLQMIMEFCPGGTLAELIKSKGALKPARAIQIAREVGHALAHAHQHQFIHRDVKPANVFFMNDGAVKLGDFGIAASVTSHEYTQTGMIIGTPIYMAPEQSSDSRDVDPRADIYSLGLTLYVMLTGHSPRVIDLDLVPPAFRSLIKHATYPDRNQRMVSAEQFCATLDQIEREFKAGKTRGEQPTADAGSTTIGIQPPATATGAGSAPTLTMPGQPAAAKHARPLWAMAAGVMTVIALAAVASLTFRGGDRKPVQTAAAIQTPAAAIATPAATPSPQPTVAVVEPPFRPRPIRPVMSPLFRPPQRPPRLETPPPLRPVAEDIRRLLATNRDLNTAFENFKDYDKLAQITRQLTISDSHAKIGRAIEDARRSRRMDLPPLHLIAAYAYYRDHQLQQARQQIAEARWANRPLQRPYDIDNRREVQDVFNLSDNDYNQLYASK